MNPYFDNHPNPMLLLQKNKAYLQRIVNEVRSLGPDFVNNKSYTKIRSHTNVFFRLIGRVVKNFNYKPSDIKIFLSSFVLIDNLEYYNIGEETSFYNSINDHVQIFEEYLRSDVSPEGWLVYWDKYLLDFKRYKHNDKQYLIQKELIQKKEKLGSPKSCIPMVNNITKNINELLQNKNITKENKNITNEDNNNPADKKDIPVEIDIHTMNEIRDTLQSILWEKIRQDLNKPIKNWEYTWTLFEDLVTAFCTIVSNNREDSETIRKDLDPENWKRYIIKHEDKEVGFKEYFASVHDVFLFLGVSKHRDRYLRLNQECNQIISKISFEKAIPLIFQKIYNECDILLSNTNYDKLGD